MKKFLWNWARVLIAIISMVALMGFVALPVGLFNSGNFGLGWFVIAVDFMAVTSMIAAGID